MTAMLNIKLYYKVNSISQLLDLIEPWDFVKTSSMSRTSSKSRTSRIMNIVDVNNNNNKDNDSNGKIENFIIKLTQYLSSWT